MPRTFLESLYKLDGAVAVVTGGASGIGLATVRALDAVGAAVVVLDRQEPPPACASDDFHVTDIADLAAVSHVMGSVHARHGRLDVLVNCAGMAIRQPALERKSTTGTASWP